MIYTHLGAVPSPKGILQEHAIELLPNVGFSLQGVLDVLCTMWQPSNGALKALKKSLCWAKDNLMTAEGRRKLCELLVNKAQDILQGLAEAAGQKMLEWAQVAGIGGSCSYCSGNVNVKDVLEDIGKAVMGAIGSDGISYTKLAQNIGFAALAEAACCAVMLGLAAVMNKLPITRAFDGLKRQCAKLLQAAGEKEVPGLSTAITFDFAGSSDGGAQVKTVSTAQERLRALESPFMSPPSATQAKQNTTQKSGVSWPLLLTLGFTGGVSYLVWRRRGKR